jgi:hypothetical protein
LLFSQLQWALNNFQIKLANKSTSYINQTCAGNFNFSNGYL